MKQTRRWLACLLALLCAASAVGCGREAAASSTAEASIGATDSAAVSAPAATEDAGSPYTEGDLAVTVSYANWSEAADRLFFGGLNPEKMAISSVRHLPIYKLDSEEALEQFKQSADDILTIDSEYDEMPSFNSATAACDAAFFADNALMLVYVSAPSGSLRFGVREVFCDGNAFCIYVETTSSPAAGTADMAGWFITVAVPHDLIKDCTVFDAVLDAPLDK